MPETRTAPKKRPPAEEAAPGARAEGSKPVCTVAFCPICLAVTAAQTVAPDAMDHLLSATRELFLAARAVIDARGEGLDGSAKPARLERIEIA